eukprot:Sro2248_g320700.2  (374) ;mRNA; f:10453-11574
MDSNRIRADLAEECKRRKHAVAKEAARKQTITQSQPVSSGTVVTENTASTQSDERSLEVDEELGTPLRNRMLMRSSRQNSNEFDFHPVWPKESGSLEHCTPGSERQNDFTETPRKRSSGIERQHESIITIDPVRTTTGLTNISALTSPSMEDTLQHRNRGHVEYNGMVLPVRGRSSSRRSRSRSNPRTSGNRRSRSRGRSNSANPPIVRSTSATPRRHCSTTPIRRRSASGTPRKQRLASGNPKTPQSCSGTPRTPRSSSGTPRKRRSTRKQRRASANSTFIRTASRELEEQLIAREAQRRAGVEKSDFTSNPPTSPLPNYSVLAAQVGKRASMSRARIDTSELTNTPVSPTADFSPGKTTGLSEFVTSYFDI